MTGMLPLQKSIILNYTFVHIFRQDSESSDNDWEDMPETPEEIRRLQTTRSKTTVGNFTCVYCHKKYKTRGGVRSHVSTDNICQKIHKRKKLKPIKEDQDRKMSYDFVCTTCQKGMPTKDAYYKHQQRYHSKK